MKIIFNTPRFIVREYQPKDIHEFVNLLTDPEVRLYLPQHSVEKWKDIFNDNLTFYHTNPGLGRWAVIDKTTERLMGNCMLLPGREGLPGFEVGYAFEKPYWGTGVGTEITGAIAGYGFALPGVKSIYAITSMPNIASQRVLLKAGFQSAGTVQLFGLELLLFNMERSIPF